MNRWHNQYIDGHPHFCTATIQDWAHLLVDDGVRILYEEWNSARTILGVKILAYVVMPNHVHNIVRAEKGDSISKFLRRTMSLTAKRIKPGGGLWKERPRVIAISSSSVLQTKVDYLHRNPIRAELVENPEDWVHSSYRQLVLCEPNPAFICDAWEGLTL